MPESSPVASRPPPQGDGSHAAAAHTLRSGELKRGPADSGNLLLRLKELDALERRVKMVGCIDLFTCAGADGSPAAGPLAPARRIRCRQAGLKHRGDACSAFHPLTSADRSVTRHITLLRSRPLTIEVVLVRHTVR